MNHGTPEPQQSQHHPLSVKRRQLGAALLVTLAASSAFAVGPEEYSTPYRFEYKRIGIRIITEAGSNLPNLLLEAASGLPSQFQFVPPLAQ